jgi:predicted nucleotidyltransferase
MPTPKIPFPVDQIAAFCQKWKITELAVFGSVLRDDFRPDSDVDILVSFTDDAHWSLYDWVDMQEELHGIIGRQVDLVEKKGLHNPFRRHAILTTKQVIYAA